MKGFMRLFLLLALASIAPLSIAAQQGTWGSKGDGATKADANVAKTQPAPTAPRRTWGTKAPIAPATQPAVHHADWREIHRDHDRDDDRPPGWRHGRKVGWHGNDAPPGQLKKDPYEHHYRHYRHHHRRDWERDHERWRHHRHHDRDRH